MISRSFRDKFARPQRDPTDNNKRMFMTSILKMITRGIRIWTRRNMKILNEVDTVILEECRMMKNIVIQMNGLRTK